MAATAVTITAGSFSNLFPTPTVHASDVLPSKDENSDENTSFMSGEWLKTTQQDPILPSLSNLQRRKVELLQKTEHYEPTVEYCQAAFLMPFLVLRARKFALLFTLGSLFTIGSFSMLWGPVNHLKHLFSSERLTFTLTYFLSLFVTLYAALIVRKQLCAWWHYGVKIDVQNMFIVASNNESQQAYELNVLYHQFSHQSLVCNRSIMECRIYDVLTAWLYAAQVC
ncbi:uncharacterized protein TRIADDRAFT_57527 [Trichoplax adhaerens]|uniref:Vesicle transport protein n=1 Tax=Trichoplax adhaerens TaxID=10228 RepID=B3RZP3_TRIAD|nr:hypothetical protein TRIADDRAFT_57527 [Trichoplax adhaerens]EDV23876.1 hypothetical protein TRIADDRAFT_57527 [Trichoplax adhaerens]|eukprot:XP_002113402.1 hypothetical protein TRIADDRAFT_57527 [Trichoplax adhaerens]